ncbi:substrate-binding domain-containing protein [uncultured Streptomyces sp.]|uniref:substrate-binding domain-containing protein n=1 Tax=uncultured Streptomyces sp. TaxID=174707 RepID=UPI0026151EAB|nr:substrate-binding domain-containing protein [uncultured Streptomyces sp.]
MRFTMDERHTRILELVRTHGSLRVAELAEHLGVSRVTARRDVDLLTDRGTLRRSRGAVSWPGASPVPRLPRAGSPDSGPRPEEDGTPRSDEMFGMILPRTRHYYDEVVRGVRETVAAAGGRLVLDFTRSPADTGTQIARMADGGARGLLLIPDWADGWSGREPSGTDSGLPTVLLERRGTPGTRAALLDRVCSDHAAGAGLAVTHLAALGHRRFALVGGPSPTRAQTSAGAETALRALGLDEHPLVAFGFTSYDPEEEQRATADRLAGAVAGGSVTAALVIDDSDAMTLVQLLRERGVEVPRDLALVAYDDHVASLSPLPLTAVALPKYDVGRIAVELLRRRVRESGTAGTDAPAGAEAGPRHHLDLMPRLVVRDSCGARPGQDLSAR